MNNNMKRESKKVIILMISLLFVGLFVPLITANIFEDFGDWINQVLGLLCQ